MAARKAPLYQALNIVTTRQPEAVRVKPRKSWRPWQNIENPIFRSFSEAHHQNCDNKEKLQGGAAPAEK